MPSHLFPSAIHPIIIEIKNVLTLIKGIILYEKIFFLCIALLHPAIFFTKPYRHLAWELSILMIYRFFTGSLYLILSFLTG